MEEDDTFDEFYAKLLDIVNSAFNLGDQIPKPKIVRKVLRSLPKKFHAKITAIEESKDTDEIPLTELIGNLQTYEFGLTRLLFVLVTLQDRYYNEKKKASLFVLVYKIGTTRSKRS